MKLSSLLYFLFLININLFAQKTKLIKNDISVKVEAIDKGKNYKTVELEQDEFMDHATDRGGSLTGFFKNNKLVKIVSWIGLSNYYAVDEYFLESDRLIYVHERESWFDYNDSTGTFNDTAGVHFDGGYWFNKNKEIDEISLGHNRFEGDDADPEKEFLAEVKKYILLLYKKYKSGKK